MTRDLHEKLGRVEDFLGTSLWRYQLVLGIVALAVSALFWLFKGDPSLPSTLLFTFVCGNVTTFAMATASPLYEELPVPRDWIVYLALLVPVGAIASLIASTILFLFYIHAGVSFAKWTAGNLEIGTLISLLTGVSVYAVGSTRSRLEARNRQLQTEVQSGAVKLQAQEAELKTAHEIQAHLLPAEIPQIARFQISCAWQPAQSVGGDYFDVLAFTETKIAVALADVSGKGITAALLMANLQAAFRAFASENEGPGALCSRLNRVLCSNIAPGKFVTFFYGVLDNETLSFRYENAGHCAPILLRGERYTSIEEGGTVLGIFAEAQYTDRSLQLEPGDCLLLTTDGVTEAADADGEEFGADRMAEAALRARELGAAGMRSRILEEVTRFCNGAFHDDASLVVITVDS